MVFRKILHFLDRVSKAGMGRCGEAYRKKQGSGDLTVFSEWFPVYPESSEYQGQGFKRQSDGGILCISDFKGF